MTYQDLINHQRTYLNIPTTNKARVEAGVAATIELIKSLAPKRSMTASETADYMAGCLCEADRHFAYLQQVPDLDAEVDVRNLSRGLYNHQNKQVSHVSA